MQQFGLDPADVRVCYNQLPGIQDIWTTRASQSCSIFVRFTFEGADYHLAMSSGPGAVINYPETNDALVTCTALNSSNQCNAWTILPFRQADGTVQNVARLESLTRGAVAKGDFYLTFKFNVTNP